jgi:outer membrane protein OmpA-like peptidoglycan-associated protein
VEVPPPAAGPTPAPPKTSADQRAATPAALTIERRWLQSWFSGTPVVIQQRRDAAVNVEIPREFCFDPGRSTVKPALGAVLDKVAESLRRVPTARLAIAAPADGTAANAALAAERGARVQQHLVSRGVLATRLGQPTIADAPAVQLRIEATPM